MTNPYLALEHVSCVLPDGRTLFTDLSERFDRRATGLVGRNGVGKTTLARLLAGETEPTGGHCVRSGTVRHLPQHASLRDRPSVAALAGVQATMDALGRIEAGGTDPADFEAIGDRWDMRQRLRHELERNGLAHLDPDTPTGRLSGGEVMRVALIGALLSDADFLILDEPSNHLDDPNRRALIEQLLNWPKGLLVISHDRSLLETMQRIVELSPLGLRSYGGGYTFYEQCKARERENAIQELDRRKMERRREQRSLHARRERQERRQAHGNQQAREANQAKILLGRQKERSEGTAARQLQKQAVARGRLAERVREAAQRVDDEAPVTLHAPSSEPTAQRRVLELHDVELPFVPPATRRLSLTLTGRQRLAVVGPNGCGKSTLLKLMAGRIMPLAGRRSVRVESAYLDQQFAAVPPQRSTIEQMRSVNREASQTTVRTWLAQLGLSAGTIVMPGGLLSGGERLKAALACVLYADPPAELLLLDEPSNHLDLAAVQALESMLRQYRGALVVVSHDTVFLDRLGLTDRLSATTSGWRLAPW